MLFRSRAHIFILDSLGTLDHREPKKVLSEYLLQEAHDKELITNAAFEDPAVKVWVKSHVAGHNVKVSAFTDSNRYALTYVLSGSITTKSL